MTRTQIHTTLEARTNLLKEKLKIVLQKQVDLLQEELTIKQEIYHLQQQLPKNIPLVSK